MSIKDLNTIVETPPAEIEYYYDSHPTKEDLMAESAAQFHLVIYLVGLLEWLYRYEQWYIGGNINIYPKSRRPKSYPIAPDVAVFKGVVLTREERRRLKSWKMILPNRPPPAVVFEISSDETWEKDINEKPVKYQQWGMKEYFAYDPNDPQIWRDRSTRLRGWRYNLLPEANAMEELVPNEQGWLWSEELESWLVPDGERLRLYDAELRLRLTETEQGAIDLEISNQREEEAHQREEEARQREETQRTAKEAAWAKLRELGVDPENL